MSVRPQNQDLISTLLNRAETRFNDSYESCFCGCFVVVFWLLLLLLLCFGCCCAVVPCPSLISTLCDQLLSQPVSSFILLFNNFHVEIILLNVYKRKSVHIIYLPFYTGLGNIFHLFSLVWKSMVRKKIESVK